MSPPTPTSIMLVTGQYFDHLDPDPTVINLDVIEHGLRATRFNGQTIRPISIAEHSLRVRRITRELGGDEDAELWALNHDDHEALVPWGDCLGPGKTDEMREVEMRVDHLIAAKICDWPCAPPDRIYDIVKTADALALYFEAMLWQPGAIDWAPYAAWLGNRAMGDGDYRAQVAERFMPLIAPRPGECWRTQVEGLLSSPDPNLTAIVWAEIAGMDELARKLRSPTTATLDCLVANDIEERAKRLRRSLVAEGEES